MEFTTLAGVMSPLHMKVRNPMASLTLWDLLSSTKLSSFTPQWLEAYVMKILIATHTHTRMSIYPEPQTMSAQTP